jgi:hypothetical protein
MKVINSKANATCLTDRIWPNKGQFLIGEESCMHCSKNIYIYSNKRPQVVNIICPHCNKKMIISFPTNHYNDY